MRLVGNASQNLIGGTVSGAGNLISGNAADGIDVGSAQVGVVVPAYFLSGHRRPRRERRRMGGHDDRRGTDTPHGHFESYSGPAASADPNYTSAMTSLEKAGGKVIAYIPTDYANKDGTAPLATVETEANTYISQYGSLIEGFFIDEMTNDNSSADLNYYHSLYTYLKGLAADYQIIGNPGADRPRVPGPGHAGRRRADDL